MLFFISALVVFSFRLYFDSLCQESGLGLSHDFAHFEKIPASLHRLFSFHGLYEIFSIVGVWGLLFVFVLNKNIRMILQNATTLYMILFLLIVFLHAILSTELSRMFYLATPILAIWIALIVDQLIIINRK